MEGRDFLHRKLETGVRREPSFGNLKMDLRNQSIENTKTGVTERLSASEYKLLWMLVRAQGNLITESEMNEFMYEERPDHKDLPLSNTVKVFITKLRHKLQGVLGETVQIESEQGMGYRLVLESARGQA